MVNFTGTQIIEEENDTEDQSAYEDPAYDDGAGDGGEQSDEYADEEGDGEVNEGQEKEYTEEGGEEEEGEPPVAEGAMEEEEEDFYQQSAQGAEAKAFLQAHGLLRGEGPGVEAAPRGDVVGGAAAWYEGDEYPSRFITHNHVTRSRLSSPRRVQRPADRSMPGAYDYYPHSNYAAASAATAATAATAASTASAATNHRTVLEKPKVQEAVLQELEEAGISTAHWNPSTPYRPGSARVASPAAPGCVEGRRPASSPGPATHAALRSVSPDAARNGAYLKYTYVPGWAVVARPHERLFRAVLDHYFRHKAWPPFQYLPPTFRRMCLDCGVGPNHAKKMPGFAPIWMFVLKKLDKRYFMAAVDHFFEHKMFPNWEWLPQQYVNKFYELGITQREYYA